MAAWTVVAEPGAICRGVAGAASLLVGYAAVDSKHCKIATRMSQVSLVDIIYIYIHNIYIYIHICMMKVGSRWGRWANGQRVLLTLGCA